MAISISELYSVFQDHRKVCTDSRKIEEGDLYFALKGERFDGNAFAAEALDGGASYAVIDDETYEQEGTLLVPNVLGMLQRLAGHHREQFDIPLLAITGSNGKTTTKELIGAVLSTSFETHVTSGNLNNHIGLPLTLLDMPDDTECAVIEMGASASGEIAALCRIAHPNHGLITNVGEAHIEGFGSLEGVKRGKGELYEYLKKEDGLVFLPEDEPYLEEMARGLHRIVRFAQADAPEAQKERYSISSMQIHPRVILKIPAGQKESLTVHSALFGIHNFKNLMAAVAVGFHFNIPPDKIKQAIEDYRPSGHRSEWKTVGTNRFLMDCYNANPVSMRAAIDSFKEVDCDHKILILGDMLELGSMSRKEHRKILDYVSGDHWDDVYLVGEEFAPFVGEEGVRHVPDVQALKDLFDHKEYRNACFLLKGSRGIRLEDLLDD